MVLVAGIDFGTLSVRVSIYSSQHGLLGMGTAEYPLKRKKDDPDYATESHADHMRSFVEAFGRALKAARIDGASIQALAADATGSTIVPVDANLAPLDDYYMWCDHRAKAEAALITETARRMGLEALEWSGGTYPAEGGFAKLLHWLRHNPEKRGRLAAVLEHVDMFPATLCGVRTLEKIARSIAVAGPKWMWNPDLGGWPPAEFLAAVDPLFEGILAKLAGRMSRLGEPAGFLSGEWAARLGLKPSIPVATCGLDGHLDTLGAGIREGDVVTVLGTSAPIMALARKTRPIPGTCGAAFGAVHPDMYAIEAGLGASGDLWEAIARRAGAGVSELSRGLENYRAGQTGLMRLTWDNGDRTVLVNAELGGITLGWKLTHTAQDELFAAFEGTALHTRIVLERLQEYGVPFRRLIIGGRVPQKNKVITRIYANVLGKPVLAPEREATGLGAAIFAFLAAGAFRTVEEAEDALCPGYRIVEPDPQAVEVYNRLYPLFRRLYFGFGRPGEPGAYGDVLAELRRIASEAAG